ncbi:MAG: hypothetical protein M1819_006397 [Sarea resinae]|nr:MAG: hypothetical protein M1819_006397 [Sarea resinae]
MASSSSSPPSRPVFFFDIDNCLYPRSYKVHELMTDLIDKYFMNHLSLSQSDAYKLHMQYYKSYGLALEGLVRHHKIDPLEYNSLVDDALPLENVIKPDAHLRTLLCDLDTSTIKPWLFTNAYVNHGRRVVKLLGVSDCFEGITFCDYDAETLICKPHDAMFEKAHREAGVEEPADCYFVDDSYINCRAAQARGWNVAHLLAPGDEVPEVPACRYQIRSLDQLREIWPKLFRSTQHRNGEVTEGAKI